MITSIETVQIFKWGIFPPIIGDHFNINLLLIKYRHKLKFTICKLTSKVFPKVQIFAISQVVAVTLCSELNGQNSGQSLLKKK